jgi:predicted Zn finger-like uncharacterized protein
MFTQCPECKALFQVSDAQLAAAHGDVRCGQCLTVFSAPAHERADLLEKYLVKDPRGAAETGAGFEPAWPDDRPLFEQAPPPAPPAAPADASADISGAEAAAATPALTEDSLPRDAVIDIDLAEIPQASAAPAGAEPEAERPSRSEQQIHAELSRIWRAVQVEPATETPGVTAEAVADVMADVVPENRAPEPPPAAPASSAAPPSRANLDETNPAPVAEAAPAHALPAFILEEIQAERASRARRARLPWLLGSLLLLLLLGAQGVYLARDPLAQDPRLRPYLAEACALLGCTLAPAYDVERIRVISLDVRSHPRQAGGLVASTAIVNQADFAQPFPLLTLTFSNMSGSRLAQRRFLPEEYLPAHVDRAAGLAPGRPLTLELELLDPGEQAVNFEFIVESDPRQAPRLPQLKNPLSDLFSRL